ncbi:MAG: hypothetical protein JSW08_01225 [archaeon]|nr:MAG: hypothetical protein JSW08_01225 [archaeon]
MKKRGEISQAVLIGLIILIVGAALLLIIFMRIPYKSTSEKEACHQSVLLRSKSILGLEPGQSLVPLNCRTQNITISTRSEAIISREIANEMYGCKWMFSGEDGTPLDFFGEGFWRTLGIPGAGTAKSACVICTIIEFDENLKERPMDIDFLRYIEKTKIPEKNITYLDYFTGQENSNFPEQVSGAKIRTSQDYAIVYMGIKGGGFGEALRTTIGTTVVGGVVGLAFGGPKGALIGAGIGLALQLILQPITQLTSSHAAAVHCDGERKGCVTLHLVPYSADSLSSICQKIDSIP